MELKKYIENHPIKIYSTAIIIGFLAGFAVNEYFVLNSGNYLLTEQVEKKYMEKKLVEKDYILVRDCDLNDKPKEAKKDFCQSIGKMKSKVSKMMKSSIEAAKRDKRKMATLLTTKEELDYNISPSYESCSSINPSQFIELQNNISRILSKNGLPALD